MHQAACFFMNEMDKTMYPTQVTVYMYIYTDSA